MIRCAAPFSFRLHEEPHDYFRVSPDGLRELCGRAGLEIELRSVLAFWTEPYPTERRRWDFAWWRDIERAPSKAR